MAARFSAHWGLVEATAARTLRAWAGSSRNCAGGIGGFGDAVEDGLESGSVAGVKIDERAEGEGDDGGVVGEGVLNALDDPGEESGGLTTFALGCGVG